MTIRVPETLAAVYMPKIVERFHKDNPNVKLNLINCTDFQLREELNSGRIDLAFLMTNSFSVQEVNKHDLKVENLVLISGSGHSLSKREKVTIDDLDRQTVLLPKTD